MKHIIFFFILLFFTSHLDAQTLSELQNERKKTEESIALTNKLINENKKHKNQELSQLKLINRKINYRKKLISDIDKENKTLAEIIEHKEIIIESYAADLESQKENYAELLRYIWTRRSTQDQLMYILAGNDITQMYRRFRYLNEFAGYQKAQATAIQELSHRLTLERDSLNLQKEQQTKLLAKYSNEREKLQSEQNIKEKQVKSLDKKEEKLRKQLAEQQKKRDELKKFVDRLIAEEAKKAKKTNMKLTPEQKLTSSQFIGNKGKLPWPVASGIIDEPFGKHKHDQFSRVEVENDGIDILTDQESNARSVFDGEVISVNALPGYNKGLIIQHGEYYTFYANLKEVYVKKGDMVSTKQSIGKIFTDNAGKTLIHFEVWIDFKPQNPASWLSK